MHDEARVDEDKMGASLSCSPPLGQTTVIDSKGSSVQFTVLLEASSSDQPEVSLWHNHKGEEDWSELALTPIKNLENLSTNDVLLVRGENIQVSHRHWFQGTLQGSAEHSVNFTLKYRSNSQSNWQWFKDTTGTPDGQLHYQSSVELSNSSSTKLDHFFSDISSDIKISQIEAETPHTTLYSLTSSVSPAKGEDSGYQHHRLGKAKKSSKWFALVRLWSPWLAPRHGDGGNFELDKDGVLLSFLRTDGMHVVCLGISGIEDVMSTFIHEDGNVIIKGRNDREEAGTSRVLVAVAKSFEVANCAVMYHARKVMADHSAASEQRAGIDREIATLTDEKVKPEWLEEWWDGFTYCTWNGLGQNLTAQKIIDALDDLSKNEIKVTNLIIDDNWQSLSTGETQFKRGWSDFEANSTGFPDGLKKTTAEIRKRHPNVNHIAVWHAILGYWGGIDPNGNIAKKYKTIEVEKEPGVAGGTFTVVAAEDAQRMYDDFYSFLSSNGIDAAKTDAQFFLDMLLHAPDRRKMITEYQDAWTLAHLRHLSSRAISCMSQFPQALFHSQLPRNKPLLLVRNSDDFFPDVEASHPWHIFCNAHNSLLTQHLNALPDWDMFQTSHKWAGFHAAARCVSGGPIYFTDKPGEHNIQLIRAMTGITTRDKTVILRPHRVGRTVGSVYNPYDAHAILKIGTYVGFAQVGAGIIGCFNVSPQPLREFIKLEDFPGTDGGSYVVGSFCSGQMSKPLSRDAHNHSAAHLELEPAGWDILTAYAVRSFDLHHNGKTKSTSVAMMGLLGKMTGAAAVSGCDMYVESNGRLRLWVSLKVLGVLGIWISDLDSRKIDEDFMVVILGKPIPIACVRKSDKVKGGKDGSGVLEIDVEKAWKEMKLEPGWSNEVSLEVFVH